MFKGTDLAGERTEVNAGRRSALLERRAVTIAGDRRVTVKWVWCNFEVCKVRARAIVKA